MRRVFVSCSQSNFDVVTPLVWDLEAGGVEVWYDQTRTGGQRWWDAILNNILNSDIFLFALSPESWESDSCRSELRYGVQLDKPILPVLISDGVNLNPLPPPFSELRILDYRRREKGTAFRLHKAINEVPTVSLPDPLPTPPPVPVSRLYDLKERIAYDRALTLRSQDLLFSELVEELRDGQSPTEIRDLLLQLRRRDDLLARVANDIDKVLEDMERAASEDMKRASAIQPEEEAPETTLTPLVSKSLSRLRERLVPKSDSNSPKIFMSYSRSDSTAALNLAKDLKAVGANVWLDQLDIGIGHWDSAVEKALGESECLLVLLSPASVGSTNVMDEVSYAFDEKKSILPVMIEKCKVPLRLRRLQSIDFSKDYDESLKRLCDTLKLAVP